MHKEIFLKILLLDNYDSFTWNIFHYVEQFAGEIDVIRNDEIDPESLDQYSHIILSPGPGLPSSSGRMPEVIRRSIGTKKMLGICLGMQAIAEHMGAHLYNLEQATHGISVPCKILKNDDLFFNLGNEIMVGRYHSWAVDITTLPAELECIATDHQNIAMAIRHRSLPVHGIQFHPESVLTPDGLQIIRNWITPPAGR